MMYVYVSWYLVTRFVLNCMKDHFRLKGDMWFMAWKLQIVWSDYGSEAWVCIYDLRYLHSHIFDKVDLCNKTTEKLQWVGVLVLNRVEELFVLLNNRVTETRVCTKILSVWTMLTSKSKHEKRRSVFCYSFLGELTLCTAGARGSSLV